MDVRCSPAPTASNWLERIEARPDDAHVVGFRRLRGSGRTSGDQGLPQSLILCEGIYRISPGIRVCRIEQDRRIAKKIRSARECSRQHRATQRERLERWKVVRAEKRREHERLRLTIQRGK